MGWGGPSSNWTGSHPTCSRCPQVDQVGATSRTQNQGCPAGETVCSVKAAASGCAAGSGDTAPAEWGWKPRSHSLAPSHPDQTSQRYITASTMGQSTWEVQVPCQSGSQQGRGKSDKTGKGPAVSSCFMELSCSIISGDVIKFPTKA